MRVSAPGRLFRTLRHLRPGQIAAQLRVRATPGWHDASWIAGRTPPPTPRVRWQPVAAWLHPDPQANTAAAIKSGRFTFVNDERQAGWPPDYDTAAPLLWQYNLHYLEWLWALPSDERLACGIDWSERHPPAAGAVGWAPYPTSLRLPTLCLLAAESPAATAALWPTIWRQAEHLSKRLEYHLLGNHLLENGIALAFVGSCFAGPAADRWLRTALDLLRRQLPEQILPDGMHFERSPMYQVRLTHALALLANTGDAAVRQLVIDPLTRMAEALIAMCHPDGQIALFNDSALGVYPEPGKVTAFAAAAIDREASLQARTELPDAGYFIGRGAAESGVFCDAGPLGPDYLPGHAHGDIFSFELSLGGRRVVVDSGTFDYVPSTMRSYCRSTAAHNTVTVDDHDQAEFWGAFRVGRRGRPHDVRHIATSDGFELSGWHDGFRHLPGSPIHRRRFRWHDAGVLLVSDEVTSTAPVTAAARIQLHPDCRIVQSGDRSLRITCGDVPFTIAVGQGPAPRLTEGWYCPRFGVRERSTVVVLESRGSHTQFRYVIGPGHDLAFNATGDSAVAGGCSYAA